MQRSPLAPARLAAAAFLAVATAMPLVSAAAQSRGEFGAIWCYDAERDALARVVRDACTTGRIVDDAEAARLGQARADRVRKVIGDLGPRRDSRPPPPSWVTPTEPGSPGGAPPRPSPDAGPPRALPDGEPPPRAAVPPPPDITVGRIAKAHGTGFFVNETGAVLTNFHVAGSCGAVTVTAHDGRPVAARVAASAPVIDLLLLKAAVTPPAVARFSRDPAKVASDRALLVGYSLKGQPTLTATPSSARVSAAVLATDAWRIAFNGRAYPGHSGSPLLNEHGEVVGVVHMRAVTRTAYADGEIEAHRGLAISLRATRQFLVDNKVSFQTGSADRSFSDAQLLERARRFVARVQCWS